MACINVRRTEIGRGRRSPQRHEERREIEHVWLGAFARTLRIRPRIIVIGMLLSMVIDADAQDFTDPVDAAETFLDRMVHGEFDEARGQFDQPMNSAMPGNDLEQTWNVFTAQTGPFEEVVQVRREIAGMFHIAIFTCKFKRSFQDIKVVVNNAMEVSGLYFLPPPDNDTPPPYGDSARFDESAIEIGTGDWVLPGTLSMPKGDGPFPAVVLVHGSGPQDRDETIGPNKPFRDLAWGLATRGVAVLRYEKRTKHYQARLTGALKDFTVNEETVDDASAAVNVLRFTPKIDNGHIYVVGHSLGGTLAPRIAKKNSAIAGIIVLAGSTRPLGDILLEQMEYVFGLDGTIAKDEQMALDTTREKIALAYGPGLSEESTSGELLFGVPASYWLDFRAYDPVATAVSLDKPMLFLQGGRDYQVTEKDFAGWRNALRKEDRATFKFMPNLNHVFMAGTGKSTPNEYAIAGHIDVAVVDVVAEWIHGHR